MHCVVQDPEADPEKAKKKKLTRLKKLILQERQRRSANGSANDNDDAAPETNDAEAGGSAPEQ